MAKIGSSAIANAARKVSMPVSSLLTTTTTTVVLGRGIENRTRITCFHAPSKQIRHKIRPFPSRTPLTPASGTYCPKDRPTIGNGRHDFTTSERQRRWRAENPVHRDERSTGLAKAIQFKQVTRATTTICARFLTYHSDSIGMDQTGLNESWYTAAKMRLQI